MSSSNNNDTSPTGENAGPFLPVERVLSQAKAGDLIEINRKGATYTHWVVYIGEGNAIHVFLASKFEKTAVIKKERLVDICNGDKCRVNNLTLLASKKGLCARDAKEIVKDAESALGQEVDYQVLSENCEFFATACRYGQAFCSQVERPSDTLINWGTVGVVAGACAVLIGHLIKLPGNRRHQQ